MPFAPAARDAPLLGHIGAMDVLGPTYSTLNPSSNGYPLSNLALFVPFSVPVPVIAREGWVQCGITAGNFDIGIYDAGGTRLTSSGSTAKSASLPTNTTTLTNYTLVPNIQYYMAFASDGTTNFFSSTNVKGLWESQGVMEMQTAFALPSSATYVKTTRAFMPLFGLNFLTTGF